MSKLKRLLLSPLMRKRDDVLVERHVSLIGCELHTPIKVGLRSYSNFSTFHHVEVGRYCSIGRRCSIGAAAHDTTGLTTHSDGAAASFERAPRTRIGHDVWIGDHVVIMPGLTIGTGAVIGAGAVVTRDVPPYDVVVGVPARHLKWRFDESVRQSLTASEWWRFGDNSVALTKGLPIMKALEKLHHSESD